MPSCPITNEGSFLETFLYALDCLHIEDFVLNEFGGNTCLSLFLLKKKCLVFSLLFGVFSGEFSWTYFDNYWIEHSC